MTARWVPTIWDELWDLSHPWVQAQLALVYVSELRAERHARVAAWWARAQGRAA